MSSTPNTPAELLVDRGDLVSVRWLHVVESRYLDSLHHFGPVGETNASTLTPRAWTLDADGWRCSGCSA